MNDWFGTISLIGCCVFGGALIGVHFQVSTSSSFILLLLCAAIFVLNIFTSKDDEATA